MQLLKEKRKEKKKEKEKRERAGIGVEGKTCKAGGLDDRE